MNEWELLKENVQPIRSGGNMKALKSALNQRPYELNRREMKRKEFESKVRSHSGSDLLSVYHNYIHWVEQNCSTGGNEADMKTLLKQCIERFYSSEQYRNDRRLLNIFLLYIKGVDNPLEMFHFFHNNGFATQLTQFYTNWSLHLENAKNCRKAAEVLRSGAANGAEPAGALKRALERLETRVAKVIANNKTDDLNDNESNEVESIQRLNALDVRVTRLTKEMTELKGLGHLLTERVLNFVQNSQQMEPKAKPLVTIAVPESKESSN